MATAMVSVLRILPGDGGWRECGERLPPYPHQGAVAGSQKGLPQEVGASAHSTGRNGRGGGLQMSDPSGQGGLQGPGTKSSPIGRP